MQNEDTGRLLRQTEERLQLALTVGRLASWHWQLPTGEMSWNDEHFRILGYEPGEVEPSYQAWADRVHPEDRPLIEAKFRQSLEQGGDYVAEYRTLWRDGTVRWAEVRGRVERDAAGQPVRSYGIILDVTERNVREEQLRRKSEELERLLDVVPAAIWLAHDPECRNITGNAYADRVMQVPRKENISAGAAPGTAAVSYKVFRRGVELAPEQMPSQQAAATGKPVLHNDIALHFSDGRIVHLLASAVPLFDEAGQVRGSIAAAVDISQLKQTEEALRAREEQLRLQVENTPLAIIAWGPDFRLSQWSGEAERLFGWRADEVLGKRLDEFRWVYEEDLQHVAEVAAGLIDGTRSRSVSHNRNYRKDGSVIHCEWYNSSLLDEAGQLRSALSLVLDVTDRERAEAALRESEQLYRAIGESIDYGVWVCDAEGRNIYASDSFLKLVGLTQEQCSEFGWGDVLHPEDAARTIAAWKECVRSGGTWDIEHRFRGVDGQWHPILARGVPVRDVEGRVKCWAGINLDISRMKRAEETLKSLNETLEQRVAERTAEVRWRTNQLQRLAAQMSETEERERRRLARVLHDHLQQLLVAAKFKLSAAAKRLPSGQASVGITDALSLVDRAITESRALATELSPPVLYDGGLAAALGWLGRETETRYGMSVSVHLSPETEPDDLTTKVLVFQSVRELILNAVKHAHASVLKVCLSRTADDWLQVAVEDNGAGFEPEPAGGSGSGFGLFSVRERLDVIGGKLEVVSAPAQGCKATITVPGTRVRPAPIPFAAVELPRPPSDAGLALAKRIRVLLVDDHPVLRQGLADILREHPELNLVGEAMDGQQAVDMALTIRPDVVLMDITMPRLDGVEATRRIAQAAPEIAVIGLSMHESQEMSVAMREAGASDYLTKTAPIEELVSAILRVHPPLGLG